MTIKRFKRGVDCKIAGWHILSRDSTYYSLPYSIYVCIYLRKNFVLEIVKRMMKFNDLSRNIEQGKVSFSMFF